MSEKHKINNLIDEIVRNQKFQSQVQKCIQTLTRNSGQQHQLPTFAFEKAAKYPWSVVQGNLPVEGQKMVEQITQLIGNMIDHNLHQILSRQFLNISNEMMIIRDEMTEFTKQQEKHVEKMRQDFSQQMETLKRKMIVQQSTNSKDQPFSRTRATGLLNSSMSSTHTHEGRSDLKMEIQAIKKEVELLKKSANKAEIFNTINDKVVYLQENLKNQMMEIKMKIESVKQKSQKSYHQMAQKLNQTSSKQYINAQVKRGVKSHFKVFLEEVNYSKASILKLEESMGKMDKGLQEYMSNQLKSIWVIIGNMKRRVESIEQSVNLNNQSFMM